MRIRLKDIAERAGVSITTVSHVLSGYTKSGIKRETRERVQKLAAEMGYRMAPARAGKAQARAIAFYTGHGYRDPRDPFMAEIYSGIMQACDEFGMDLLIHGDIDHRDPDEIHSKLADGRIDGLIVHAPPGDPVVARAVEAKLPAVAIADEQVAMPSVVANDNVGMDLLVAHLWEHGHRKMSFLNTIYPMTSVLARAVAFEQAVAQRGGESAVVDTPFEDPADFLKQWRSDPARPTAFCVWNDHHAYRIVASALALGIDIPKELAICGFDGVLDEVLPARRLVTIRVPWRRMAVEAVKMLAGPTHDRTVWATTRFPVELVPGDTA